ncbi:unnamed protein product [Linum tenue]|uniref:Uncharacterized protein n=1 Tax=Linum tenue TaxID=586396 RepID=A0AAV0PFK9_9ROSI|nr:unnamed protein product [Linum tenue]
METGPQGTILFFTVGRTDYGFDVFSRQLLPSISATDRRLTDGISVNFNAQFNDDELNPSIVFVSERNGSPRIYHIAAGAGIPKPLPHSGDTTLFVDRPIVRNRRLYFVSAHEKPNLPFQSWSALYSVEDYESPTAFPRRLTPPGAVDYSPALSRSGDFIAVASYGSRPWGGEFQELQTDIVVFRGSDPEKRAVVCERGGWPSWSGDSAIFFHRQAEDGWWSVFRVEFSPDNFLDLVSIPTRVTPPGVHCFTPAAMHDGGSRIAVATRRKGSKYRHIEIFDLESGEFSPVTEPVNPNSHHYNPFVSLDSKFLGYHRFRGESGPGETTIPRLDPVASPIKDLRMVRIAGAFPAFSPGGDLVAFNPGFGGLRVVKSDGSKEWTLVKDRTSFGNSWSPTERHVIYTSMGPIFASTDTTVQIARVTFDPRDLGSEATTTSQEVVPSEVKILTRTDTGNNAFPSCSPDGKFVVFRSGRSGYKNLYVVDAVEGEHDDDGSVRQLTEGKCIDTMPSWSPRGDLIAFSSNRHNPSNTEAFSIYVIRPDGSDLRRIHVADGDADRERINHVCFSRDGEWLLFTANLGGVTVEPVSAPNQFQPYGDLYVMRLDGSGLRRLTWNGYENGTPAWHPKSDCVEMKLGDLHLGEGVGDKLTGQFDEPLWISCDI